MKLLCLSDVHFGKNTFRIEYELKEVFWKYYEQEKNSIDIIAITGDLFDRPLQLNEYAGRIAINFITELAKKTSKDNIKLRIIKGTMSHDSNQLKLLKEMFIDFLNVKVIENIMEEDIEEIKILYVPEEYPSDYNLFYNEYFNSDKRYDIILGHGMLDFVSFTGYNIDDIEDGEKRMHGTPTHKTDNLISITNGPIIFGHVHDLQEYKEKAYYVGAYTRFSFDTPEDKGFLVFDINNSDTSKFEVEFIENHLAPTYGVINIDSIEGESIEEKIDIIDAMKEEFDFVKIKTGNKADLEVLNKISEKDSTLKIQTIRRDNNDIKVDKKFEFILKRELPLDETIKKFINIEYGKDFPKNIINEIISDKDNDLDNIIKMKKESTNIKKKTI